MPNQWYYSKNGKQQGTVSDEQLKQLAATGNIQPSDLVWKEGMSQWAEARRIKGLFPTISAVGNHGPPPLPSGKDVNVQQLGPTVVHSPAIEVQPAAMRQSIDELSESKVQPIQNLQSDLSDGESIETDQQEQLESQIQELDTANSEMAERGAFYLGSLVYFIGIAVWIIGLGLIIGNITRAFPTFPFAGFIVTLIGFGIQSKGNSIISGVGTAEPLKKMEINQFLKRNQ